MLDNLLRNLPKTFIALCGIIIAIGFVLLNDPPHQFCDTQVEHFKSVQSGVLFKDPTDKITSQPLMKKNLQRCRETISPGACYEYFSSLNRFLKNFNLMSKECLPSVTSISEVKSQFYQGLDTMTQLAWREEVLTGKVDKFNWLNRSDIFLLCALKQKAILLYGQDTYQSFERQILSNLPVPKKVPLKTLKKFSILSESCSGL